MSRPPINPDKTLAGIAVDPQTLERVIPESKRPDGTVRKQIKIRPGFTPQEDVRRFRGTRQAQMDAIALPKGHIVGWAPPSNASSSKAGTKSGNAFPALSKSVNSSSGGGEKPLSKSAKKNAKRKEKREEKKVTDESIFVKDNWEDDDDDGGDAKEGTPITQDGSGLSTTEASTSTQANSDSTGLEEKLSDLQVS